MLDTVIGPSSIHTAVGLLSANEMSSVLQVSPQTLAMWRCKKRGPPSIKLGKKVFYLIEEFNAWAQSEARKQRAKPRVANYAPHSVPDVERRISDF